MSRTSVYSLHIATDSDDADAVILLSDGALVAVLVELSDESHGEDRGKWIIEAVFGLRHDRIPDSFPCRESAAAWISSNICNQPFLFNSALVQLN